MQQMNKKILPLTPSQEFGQKAFDKIKSLNIEPHPDIYTLWYHYFKGNDIELIDKIDKVVNSNNNNVRLVHFQSIITFMKKEYYALDDFTNNSENIINNTFKHVDDINQNVRRLNDFIYETSNNSNKNDKQIIQDIQNESQATFTENIRLHEIIKEERCKMIALQEKLHAIKKELIIDSLTGLHNRRHFDESIEKAIQSALSENTPLSLFIFDIDHFKKFNDTHGHQTGDMVLKFVGHTMNTTFPNISHHLFRYGGEEFVVIFDNLSKSHAMKYAQMLSNVISKKELIKKSTNEVIGQITISGGIAEKKKYDTIHTLISRADVALYQAKNKDAIKLFLKLKFKKYFIK